MNTALFPRGRRSQWRPWATLLLLAPVAFSCSARPDMTPLGPNIADRGSAFYHFSVSHVDSADGKRHYKIWTAVPVKAAPAAGYPVLYLLDGNAAMDKLSEPLLQQMAAGSPPVLVAVGYQTVLPFAQAARSWDYTPAHRQGGPDLPGRERGGSATFRQLLTGTIMPQAERGLPIDGGRRALWGHSYGGLFVLDSWLSSSPFSRFFAASPSVGQGYLFLLTAMQQQAKTPAGQRAIALMEGDGDPHGWRQPAAPDVLSAVRSTVEAMQAEGAPASWRLWPGLSHGQMFGASLEAALLQMSATAPR